MDGTSRAIATAVRTSHARRLAACAPVPKNSAKKAMSKIATHNWAAGRSGTWSTTQDWSIDVIAPGTGVEVQLSTADGYAFSFAEAVTGLAHRQMPGASGAPR